MSEKRIAVCDDEKIIADHLAEIVRKCIASMDINASVTVDVSVSYTHLTLPTKLEV